ncbi:hypothetical protein DYB37_006474 [Aphanomyces astaci]|uniref:C-CAP/cofactor C-like domain-containing protein n=2 Tax=Aphanomyces astaci TaxID=112090 RepID=A0A3R6YGH6_APHAT|nr:hypothetical protein DYB37_006474 [Aphanomyces astaci]
MGNKLAAARTIRRGGKSPPKKVTQNSKSISLDAKSSTNEPPLTFGKDPTLNREDYIVSKQTDATVVKRPGTINGQQFLIEDCRGTNVFVLDQCTSVQIDECHGCTIFIGPCTASLFVRNCSNSTLVCLVQQFRTRDCVNMDIALFSTTAPIIESSAKLRIRPFASAYMGLQHQLDAAKFNVVHHIQVEEWHIVMECVDVLSKLPPQVLADVGYVEDSSIVPLVLGLPARVPDKVVFVCVSTGNSEVARQLATHATVDTGGNHEAMPKLIQTRQFRVSPVQAKTLFGKQAASHIKVRQDTKRHRKQSKAMNIFSSSDEDDDFPVHLQHRTVDRGDNDINEPDSPDDHHFHQLDEPMEIEEDEPFQPVVEHREDVTTTSVVNVASALESVLKDLESEEDADDEAAPPPSSHQPQTTPPYAIDLSQDDDDVVIDGHSTDDAASAFFTSMSGVLMKSKYEEGSSTDAFANREEGELSDDPSQLEQDASWRQKQLEATYLREAQVARRQAALRAKTLSSPSIYPPMSKRQQKKLKRKLHESMNESLVACPPLPPPADMPAADVQPTAFPCGSSSSKMALGPPHVMKWPRPSHASSPPRSSGLKPLTACSQTVVIQLSTADCNNMRRRMQQVESMEKEANPIATLKLKIAARETELLLRKQQQHVVKSMGPPTLEQATPPSPPPLPSPALLTSSPTRDGDIEIGPRTAAAVVSPTMLDPVAVAESHIGRLEKRIGELKHLISQKELLLVGGTSRPGGI